MAHTLRQTCSRRLLNSGITLCAIMWFTTQERPRTASSSAYNSPFYLYSWRAKSYALRENTCRSVSFLLRMSRISSSLSTIFRRIRSSSRYSCALPCSVSSAASDSPISSRTASSSSQ